MPRLFTAIQIPEEITRSLMLLRFGLPQARWVGEQDYHITLHFFGDVEHHLADEIVGVLDGISQTPFQLRLQGLDVFNTKKPHALYAAAAPSNRLMTLYTEMGRKLRPLRLAQTRRIFKPHVTLARIRQVPLVEIGAYLGRHGHFATSCFCVKEFVLMSSRDSTGGSPYLVEARWKLML